MKTDFLEVWGFNFIKNRLSCSSPYGDELTKRLAPMANRQQLQSELNNIAKGISKLNGNESVLMRLLMAVKNIRRTIMNIGEVTLDEVELFELKRYLIQLEQINSAYIACDFQFEGIALPDLSEALTILCIDGSCNIGFYISDSSSAELKAIRQQKRGLELKIRGAKEPELSDLKRERLIIADKEDREEAKVRAELSKRLTPYKNALLDSTYAIGRIDLLIAKAQLALRFNAIMPIMCEEMSISLTDMINPALDENMRTRNKVFTPISINTVAGSCVITGANMGGKSVALKTLALNAYLAQCGMFVFARSAKIPFLDEIVLIAEDSEDTKNGLSSFGGEIVKLAGELRKLESGTNRLMLLFDEPARGTNPQEGAKIVRALVKYLNEKKAISILTTHYDGIAVYAKKCYRVIGLRDFDFDSIKGKAGIDAVATSMNYGLYEAPPNQECPKEALGICKMLLDGEPLLDVLLEE